MEVETRRLMREFFDYTHGTRRLRSRLFSALLSLLAVVAVTPLLVILIFLIYKGANALSWEFLSSLPAPYGESGGGFGNAIVGTLLLIGLAATAGVPIGLGTGLYLSEAQPNDKMANTIRTSAEMLAGIPSILVGLFAYSVAVLPLGQFSAFAGGLALSVIIIPVIARSSEEILRLVPNHVREAGLALGLPRWKVLMHIILRGCRNGLFTTVLIALARASGETAPLLFTALNNRLWSFNPSKPIASLPVQIYTYATSPSEEWHQQAWGGALLLVLIVLGLSLFARILLNRRSNG